MTTKSWSASNSLALFAFYVIPSNDRILEIELEHDFNAMGLDSILTYLGLIAQRLDAGTFKQELAQYVATRLPEAQPDEVFDMTCHVIINVWRMRSVIEQTPQTGLTPLFQNHGKIFFASNSGILAHLDDEALFDLHQTFNR